MVEILVAFISYQNQSLSFGYFFANPIKLNFITMITYHISGDLSKDYEAAGLWLLFDAQKLITTTRRVSFR